MSTNSENNFFLNAFDAFLSSLDKHDEEEKLFMLAGLTELMRHTKGGGDVLSAATLLVSLSHVNWAQIPFSITKNLLSKGCHDDVQKLGVPPAHVATVIRSGFLLFLDEMQADPTADVSYDKLWASIKFVAELSFPPKPKASPPNPKLPVVAPEIFSPGLVRRVFEPVKFTPELAEQLGLQVVRYRSEMPGGKLGPEVRGLAAWEGKTTFDVFLETGEFLQVAADNPQLVVSTAAEDFKHISPAVMLMIVAACDDLVGWGVLSKEHGEKIKAGGLGKIKGLHFKGTTDAEDFGVLEHVFDIRRAEARMVASGATGPVGASVRIPVPSHDGHTVVVEASQDAHGPYSHARLVQSQGFEHKDVVVMRHEAPRHYSLRGVYLFPLQDRLISLTVIF
jgi:hypothetical protein